MANALYELSVNEHDGAGNFFMSRVHWEVVEGSNPDEYALAGDVITAFIASITTPWLALQGDDVILDFYKCRKVKPTGGPSFLKISGDAGAGATGCSCSGLCVDVQAQNQNASKRPGHIYIGGPYDGAISASQWQAAFATKVATLITALITGLTVGGVASNWSILQKKLGTWTHVTHANLSPKPTLLNKRTLPLR